MTIARGVTDFRVVVETERGGVEGGQVGVAARAGALGVALVSYFGGSAKNQANTWDEATRESRDKDNDNPGVTSAIRGKGYFTGSARWRDPRRSGQACS